ncbi:DcrB/PsbP domain-containing protein [Luteipulveratus halotolerans]|uniref:DUF1795 domain-containing protein n=1 Tax=Luteipulveratus halotolerans TaxID=1631356 RepID=A0A0L6CFQ7_9MICO|nr:DcrB-related protein [Luteipulveratus halotolerans]KNX36524.1 hypothetical protein VV01_04125 [Luteipulveratus halotolerans]
MRTRRYARALVPLAVLLSAGCSQTSGSDPSSVPPALPTTLDQPSPTSLTTKPTLGAVPAADRSFGVLPPSGWINDTARERGTMLYLRAPQPTRNVYPCFTVVKTTMKEPPSLDELVNQGMIAQRQKGSTVTKLASRSIGGAPAEGYTIARVSQGFQVSQTQYYVLNGTQVVVTTMTSAAQDKAAATSTQEAILASWSWGAPLAPKPTTAPSSTPSSSR